MQECQIGRAILDHDDPDLVNQMVHYMYHLTYTCPAHHISPMLFHVRMRILADKYNIQYLVQTAIMEFEKIAKFQVATKLFAHAVAALYDSGAATEEMSQAIMQLVIPEFALLDDGREEGKHLRDVLVQQPAFSADLITVLAKQKAREDPDLLVRVFYHEFCDEEFEAVFLLDEKMYPCEMCGTHMSGAEWSERVT